MLPAQPTPRLLDGGDLSLATRLVDVDGLPLDPFAAAVDAADDPQDAFWSPALDAWEDEWLGGEEDAEDLLADAFGNEDGDGGGERVGCGAGKRTSGKHGGGYELADVFRRFGPAFRALLEQPLGLSRERALREIQVCRTEVLGGYHWRCDRCGEPHVDFHSCNNRHCPKCQGRYRRDWAASLHADLLPIDYHHVIATLPRPLTWLAIVNPRVLYPLVLRAAAGAVLQVGRSWPALQAELAVIALLHTWGQLVLPHVHCHLLVPGGGLSLDGQRWVPFPAGQGLPRPSLQQRFRELFLQGLEQAYQRGQLSFPAAWQAIAGREGFERWLAGLRRVDWVVRTRDVWDRSGLAAHDPQSTQRTINYLARYVNRVALTNNRLLAISGDQVLLRYKDYRDGNQWKQLWIPGVELIRRFLLHVLPRGMRHIRRFGFLAPRQRGTKLARIRELLACAAPSPDATAQQTVPDEQASGASTQPCPRCAAGKLVLLVETPRPTIAELLRMPPTLESRAERRPVQLRLPHSAFT